MESERCFKCGAPVGAAVARCPLCGADLGQQVAGPQFQPAIVGMKESHSLAALRAEKRKQSRKNAIVGLVGVAGLLLIAGVGYAGYKMVRVPEVPVLSAPPPPLSAPAPLTLDGVAVPDPTRADPTDLLPAARKRATEGSPDFRLVEITATRGRSGVVNLTAPGAQILYRYLYEQNDPRVAKKDLKRERVDLILREASPGVERSKPAATDEPIQDPLCVWSAAWRAAVAAGLSQDAFFEARYSKRAKADKPSWVFTPVDKPEARVEVDGVSCAIRTGK